MAEYKNYITPEGHARLQAEFDQLYKVERPKVVSDVSWAASNGDRSENGDYIYGKKLLRQIDSRLRFIMKRMDSAVIVDPATQQNELEPSKGYISWISPLARMLLGKQPGDNVRVETPGGEENFEIVDVNYSAPDAD